MALSRGSRLFYASAQGSDPDQPHFAVELPGDVPHVPPHSPDSVSIGNSSHQGQETEPAPGNHYSNVRTYYGEVRSQVQQPRSATQAHNISSVNWYGGDDTSGRGARERYDGLASVDMSRSRSAVSPVERIARWQ
jgi:hypothetical protein